MTTVKILQTGQHTCYDENGAVIACFGSGQDGEYQKGIPWPKPRFRQSGDIVKDLLTGLFWTSDANPAEFPLSWSEAFDYIRSLNRRAAFGYTDWRLPNRSELRSLVSYQTKRPALPDDNPFSNVFLSWYWTSTPAAINPAYAWYINMDGARMFYGNKEQYYILWPVRGTSRIFLSGMDEGKYEEGYRRHGPEPRFALQGDFVNDRLTGLCWLRRASLSREQVRWSEAFDLIASLNADLGEQEKAWRLPNVNELESLVDCSMYAPALPAHHPFIDVRDVYWSSSTSFFEPDWAWALYLGKGALGVGFKKKREFHVWPVRDQ